MKAQLAFPLNTREPTEREAARQWALRVMGAAVVSPVVSCLLAQALMGEDVGQRVELWLYCQIFFAACSLVVSVFLLQRLDAPSSRNVLVRWLVVPVVLEALVWGLAPWLLAKTDPMNTFIPLAFVCVMCAFSLHTLCLHRLAMVVGMLCMTLPSVVFLLMAGAEAARMMALGVLLVLGLSLFYGLTSARLTREGIKASVQSTLLSDQLKSNSADLRTALRAISQMATRDPLTKVYNRRALLEFLEREMVAQDRGGPPLGVLLLDVDHFKQVNDRFGHLTGDDVLKALCHRLDNLMRGNDFLARYGGEEFVCLVHVADEQQLIAAGERIRAAMAGAPILTKPEAIQIQVSIGAAMRRMGEEGNVLFARADKALLKAKNAGRNRVVVDAVQGSAQQADFQFSSFGNVE